MNETQVINEMKEVIESSKNIRKILQNKSISFEEKKKNLEIYKTAISANKNIVSASIVILNCKKYGQSKIN